MSQDKEASKTRSSNDRQKDYKARQIAAGFRHTTVWIHTETEEEGRQAAIDGKPLKPMKSKDPLSWAAGWIKAEEEK